MKPTYFKTRKISPLDLLSRMNKLDKVSSELDFVCLPIPKIRNQKIHRYNTEPKHQEILPQINGQAIINQTAQQPAIIQKQDEMQNSISNNILKPQKSQSQKYRYYSVQKQLLRKSPYQSQISQINQAKINYSFISKIRKRKQVKKQIKGESLLINSQQPIKNSVKIIKFKVNTSVNLENILIHHYNKIKLIYKSLQKENKAHQNIIQGVRNYILEQIDSSQLQNLYLGQQSRLLMRKIIYFQRVLILLLTQIIISRKYIMHHHNFLSIFQIYLQFYTNICFDIKDQLPKEDENNQNEQIKKLSKKFCFHNAHSSIESKLKVILRHSKWMNNIMQKQYHRNHSLSPNMVYYKLLEHFSLCLLHEDCSEWRIQFLQTCPSPYLHNQPHKKYTLVLDLDQTLIHYKMVNSYNGQFLLRPYLCQFLNNLSQHYQIGIFTCSLPEYADIILNHLQHISFRLYRHHTIQIKGQFVKDLSRIGRDLRKLILVDNLDKNFRLQKQNGIHIKSWYGDRKDNWLMLLQKQLVRLAKSQLQDIRVSKHCRCFL